MNRKLLDHLLKSGVCSSSTLQRAVSIQRSRGGEVLDLLLEQGGVDESALARALGSFYNWKVVDLARVQPRREALDRANGEFCRRHLVLPFAVDRASGDLLVAVADPARAHRALRGFQAQTGQKIRPFVAPRMLLGDAIEHHYGAYDAGALSVGSGRAEVSSLGSVPALESQPGRSGASATRLESFSSVDHFFEDASGFGDSSSMGSLSSTGFGGEPDARESSLFGQSYSSTIQYGDSSRGPSVPTARGEISGFDRSARGSASQEIIERLRTENEALRQHLHRVETSLQLEINLLRELVDLLLESGVIDRRTYLERMSKLR